MITLTAFRSVPPFVQGLVRDLRVRWALEEAGLPYKQNLLALGDHKAPSYRALQPFGQVPVIEDGTLTLFETGAIVLHIADKSSALLPSNLEARERAKAWVFAALNSLEPAVANLALIDLFHANDEWAKLRRPGAEEFTKMRLNEIGDWIGDKNYLEGDAFTAGDLMTATVLRILRHTQLVTSHPVLGPYLQRCEARPAFQRALSAQMAVFAQNAA
ncbi:glutathione S-transferase [alpha proteobacterium U9-1i]|nr:glutathione S-transferase [alpha proteobacterium U9-1i]